MKIYIFIMLAAATSISLISCDSKQSDTRSASSTEVHRNDDGHDLFLHCMPYRRKNIQIK